MLIECSECKRQVSEEAVRCPQCGHRLPAAERKKILMTGVGFVAFAFAAPILVHGAGVSLPENTLSWMIMLALIGIAMMLYARFGNIGQKRP
jgi:DNA-directed RNA polymerase subunit RPC12/RpoP